jgi:hypothetical protein
MERVLFVVRSLAELGGGARSSPFVAAHASTFASDEEVERAVCLVQDGDDESGLSHLRLHQRMTVELRRALGSSAESIATFVVSGRERDDVEHCAASWGATRLVDLRGSTGGK